MASNRLRWPFLLTLIGAALALSWVSASRLSLDTDLTESLPVHDPVIAESRTVMMHHPVRDRIAIDLGDDRKSSADLVEAARVVEEGLARSGLFQSVGTQQFQSIVPELMSHVVENLPTLFTADELEKQVLPLLKPEAMRSALTAHYDALLSLDGIGQSRLISEDPLNLRNIIMAKMRQMAPTLRVRFVDGHLVSSDGGHVLIVAETRGSGTDTALARRISAAIAQSAEELKNRFGSRGVKLTLTAVGAYRAALDNEDTAKLDTRRAVIIATLGIAILLVVGFPRPWIGLLALVPAILGIVAASFVYSLFTDRISLLALGFGSTIISFTVDYGLAYLLFLDRHYETRGIAVTKEVWSLGLLAMLTTVASFAFLFASGFPVLAEIGRFSALGVAFTYIFVHVLFPVMFPVLPAAKRRPLLPMKQIVDRMMTFGGRYRLGVALAIALGMTLFARPEFRVDLAAMNSLSRETLDAQEALSATWGDVSRRIYLMTEADSLEGLQNEGDSLADILDEQVSSGVISSAFVPSMVFPGESRARKNLAAWRGFWSPDRRRTVEEGIREAARAIGFNPDSFGPFWAAIAGSEKGERSIPAEYQAFLGIRRLEEQGGWVQVSEITPGPAYRSAAFRARVARLVAVKLFDPALFGERLGEAILGAFLKMAAIVGAVTVLVAFVCLLSIRLTIVSLVPTVFSLVCTLGTLRILGVEPGIAAVLVVVIVIGMGTDYALYLVRGYQRYVEEGHPHLSLVRLTVFLSAASTLMGFGVLGLAKHALLRSAGITLVLGIGYCLVGTVLIVPPMMGAYLSPRGVASSGAVRVAGSLRHVIAVMRRLRFLGPYSRGLALVRMWVDPLFRELPGHLKRPSSVLDVATGHGERACWILELYPGTRMYGMEADERRRRVAALCIGGQGSVALGVAPEIRPLPEKVDTVLAIDVIHRLRQEEIEVLFRRVRDILAPEGILVVRAAISEPGGVSFRWRIERAWMRRRGFDVRYRSTAEIGRMIESTGFAYQMKTSGWAWGEKASFVCSAR